MGNLIPSDRRGAPRYSYQAKARLKTHDGDEVALAEVVSLGIRGCRIWIEKRLVANQEFQLTIETPEGDISARVVAVYWYKSGYAGLHFGEMTAESRDRLEKTVDFIARTYSEPEAPAPMP
jgi:PilZ domain-containing protein